MNLELLSKEEETLSNKCHIEDLETKLGQCELEITELQATKIKLRNKIEALETVIKEYETKEIDSPLITASLQSELCKEQKKNKDLTINLRAQQCFNLPFQLDSQSL